MRIIKYIKPIIALISLCVLVGCNEQKMNANRSCTNSISLEYEHVHKTKEIAVCSNIKLREMEIRNYWCSGSEPLCKKVGNDLLSIKICHKSIRNRDTTYYNSYLTKINKSELTESLELRFKDESKKYIDKPSFTTFNLSDKRIHNYRKTTYGFIQKFKDKSIFIYNYLVVNSEEFIEIEFSAEGKNLTKEFMKDEIEHIITKIDGMPMHNMG